MIPSRASPDFWAEFRKLPKSVQRQAKRAYALFKEDPRHGSLAFKRLESYPDLYSVRVGLKHRAVAVREEKQLTWFWIGSHAEYDRLISRG